MPSQSSERSSPEGVNLTEHHVICGTATGRERPEALLLSIDGAEVVAELRVSQLTRKMVSELPDILADLLEVAAFVYAADSAIRRGGPAAEMMGAAWRRDLHFEIPVRCLDLWQDAETTELLCKTLGFLSDDTYAFSFREHDGRPIEATIPFKFGRNEGWVPDEVMMFSGGLDSLAGAVEALVERQKTLALVSHHSAPSIGKVQRFLAQTLRDRTNRDQVRHFSVHATMLDQGLKERTHRARSFLFAALGLTVAHGFGLRRVDFYENGIVSLNLPPLAQFVGARATRSTHPQALAGISQLFSRLIGKDVTVANPYFWRTKKDVVTRIKELGFADQIMHSRSCANVRATSKMKPHCGRCSQCIDRRFAILGAGLEACDPSEAYDVDLLTGPRLREDRELSLAYVRNARAYRSMSPTDLMRRQPEVARAIGHLGLEARNSLQRIADLFNRHGRAVTSVMERALNEGAVAPDSLVALYAAGDMEPEPGPQPTAEPDTQPVLIEIDAQRKRALVDGKLIVQRTAFSTIETLAEAHLKSLGEGLAPEDFRMLKASTLRSHWDLAEESAVRSRIQALRRHLMDGLGDQFASLVENHPWHGYRLRPEMVTIRRCEL